MRISLSGVDQKRNRYNINNLYLESASVCPGYRHLGVAETFELWATSQTYPTCWSRQTTFADIQEPPSDLLRRRRPLPTSRSRRATSCGERPLAASVLLRRATSCGERPLAASDLSRRATSCGLLPTICILTHRLNFSYFS